MSRSKLPLKIVSPVDNMAVLITRPMSVGEALRHFRRCDQRIRREDLRSSRGDYMGMLAVTVSPISATALVKEISRCGCSAANFRVAYEMMKDARLVDKAVVAPIGNYTDLAGYEQCILMRYDKEDELEIVVLGYEHVFPAGAKLAVMRPY